MKNKKVLIIVIALVLVLGIGGVTFAWFNYYKEGESRKLVAGDIYMTYNEGPETINLVNIFPETKEEARDTTRHNVNDETNNTLTFTIDGKNTTDNTIYYEIKLNYGNEKESPYQRFRDQDIAFDLIELDANGNEVKYLLSNVTFDDWQNKRIWAEKVEKNTTTPITKKYKLRAWVSEDVIISDTESNATYPATGANAYKNHYANIKVSVFGDFQEKEVSFAYQKIVKNAITPASPINFGNISSDTNGKGLYILPGTESDVNPIYYYRGAVTDNNVIFGGFCWQMVRTTDTGGIKMIYNGVATGDGKICKNTTGASRQLATKYAFNTQDGSVSDVGYMYNQRYTCTNKAAASNSIFGKAVEWNGTNYLVIEDTSGTASTNTTKDTDHHYSCGTANVSSCVSVRYYYYNNYYITLTGGDTIEDALYKMTGNGSASTKAKNASYVLNRTDSKAKTEIENWFKTNLTNEVDASKTNYQEYLEDTIYCNDRSYKETGSSNTYNQSGWNPNGGSLTTLLHFGTLNRFNNSNWYNTINIPSMECENVTDRFSVSNQEAKLKYPVGLLTADEIILAGAAGNSFTDNTSYYLYTTGNFYWSLSPRDFKYDGASEFNVSSSGYLNSNYVYITNGLRPVVSLKLGTEFEDGGEGTTLKPYVVKIAE